MCSAHLYYQYNAILSDIFTCHTGPAAIEGNYLFIIDLYIYWLLCNQYFNPVEALIWAIRVGSPSHSPPCASIICTFFGFVTFCA